MGKMKEQNIEQEEKEVTEENTVIEAPENITGEVPASNEQEANAEQEEKEVTEENTVIEAPDNVTGDEPVSSEQVEQAEQEEVAESEVIDAPESITGEEITEDNQEESEAKYKAKVCIYYNNKKIMPGEILTGVEASTIHSLLKNGFVELV